MIILAGCGAVGSIMAMSLVGTNQRWILIDDDRVEADNLATSAYSWEHVGLMKAHALAEMMYRKVGIGNLEIEVQDRELRGEMSLDNVQVVIDCFDNAQARLLTRSLYTLHVGVSPERIGVVHWEGIYQYGNSFRGGHNPVCTHQVGQQIIQLTSAVAAGVVRLFLQTGEQKSVTVFENLVIG